MANEEHLKILKQGVEAWNEWRRENPKVSPDLIEADLSAADLHGPRLDSFPYEPTVVGRGVNLSNADLTGAKLSGACLAWANLSSASLFMADLSQANLDAADLSGSITFYLDLSFTIDNTGADLSGANLRGAYLRAANLTGVILDGADLAGAYVGWTDFGDVDLSTAEGLETVQHDWPSTIGIDTIYRSKGNIPEVFLRGAGVPDTLITYIASLVGQPTQFYSCFISYSSKDQKLAERLHNDLQSRGVRCWFAPEDMKIGGRIRQIIDQSIRSYDKLLLILSEHSIDSDWVENEVETAFEEERKRKRTILFPIRLDSAVMETDQAWAADIRRTRHIGDFSNWKDHDAYQKAFDRLLRDLKAEEMAEAEA